MTNPKGCGSHDLKHNEDQCPIDGSDVFITVNVVMLLATIYYISFLAAIWKKNIIVRTIHVRMGVPFAVKTTLTSDLGCGIGFGH